MYEYHCAWCGPVRTDVRGDSIVCPSCSRQARRVWGFSYRPSFQPGFNATLGRYVGSPTDLRSGLAEASDKASTPQTVYDAEGNAVSVERPPVNLQPVDLRDKQACGVTDQGLDSTYDAWKRMGMDDAARRLKAVMD